MINITRLYCDQTTPGDWLRYGEDTFPPPPLDDKKDDRFKPPKKASQRKPVVVWNITRACNLKCAHCYNSSGTASAEPELSTDQAVAVIDDLAAFGVPTILFSGGEPLMRKDLFELIEHAAHEGIRSVISTNGTLITQRLADRLYELGVSYVGISLDGIGRLNDTFRGVYGAFDKAVAGIRNCQDVGLRTGLRFTLTRTNMSQLEAIFEFLWSRRIERACFYHLVPTGRGAQIAADRLDRAENRWAIETILARTKRFAEMGRKMDILTVDNFVDGVYLYLKLLSENPRRAEGVYQLLSWNGGARNSSGVGIGCIDAAGLVHPNQFWTHYDLGDVRKKPFSKIWSNSAEPLLKGLRNRKNHIKGRCRLCRFFPACGGGLRLRADLHFNDVWAPEPDCYLTDDEIGLDSNKITQLKDTNQLFTMPD